MKGRQLLQVITGQSPAAEVAAIAAEIEVEKRKASEACAKVEWLERERKTADSFEAARALDERLAEARWVIEKADQLIPHLESRLKAARAEHQAEGMARHRRAAEKAYRKLKVAIEAAAAAQIEAMATREAAAAELGEGLVARIPAAAFRGFLLPDLVAIWTAEMDRAFSGPPPKPAPVPPSPATIEKSLDRYRKKFREGQRYEDGFMVESLQEQLRKASPASAAASPAINPALNDSDALPAPTPKREPRRDTKVGEGERLVSIVRNGVDVAGFQAAIGDVLSVPVAAAEGLLRGGAADYVTEGVEQ